MDLVVHRAFGHPISPPPPPPPPPTHPGRPGRVTVKCACTGGGGGPPGWKCRNRLLHAESVTHREAPQAAGGRTIAGRGCRSLVCTCCSPGEDRALGQKKQRWCPPHLWATHLYVVAGVLERAVRLLQQARRAGSAASCESTDGGCVNGGSSLPHLALPILGEEAADGHPGRLELVQEAARVAFHAQAPKPVATHGLQREGRERPHSQSADEEGVNPLSAQLARALCAPCGSSSAPRPACLPAASTAAPRSGPGPAQSRTTAPSRSVATVAAESRRRCGRAWLCAGVCVHRAGDGAALCVPPWRRVHPRLSRSLNSVPRARYLKRAECPGVVSRRLA